MCKNFHTFIFIFLILEFCQAQKNNLLDHSNYKEINSLFNTTYGLKESRLDPNGLIAIASRQDNLISTATLLCVLGVSWPNAIEMTEEIFLSSEQIINNHSSDKFRNKLLPGVVKVLETFVASKINCALISNDSKEGVKHFLKTNNIEDKFIGYWSSNDSPSKPNPNAIKEFCYLIKLDPKQCLFIGDSDSDLKMARQAEVGLTLGYTAGWASKPKLTYQQELIYSWNDLTCQNQTKSLG